MKPINIQFGHVVISITKVLGTETLRDISRAFTPVNSIFPLRNSLRNTFYRL